MCPSNVSAGVLKRSVPSTLKGRRTALPICQRRCKTGQLRRVPSAESGLQCVLFANASAASGLISSSPPPPPPENHYCYNLAFKAFRQTAFTGRETFASLENEPCRWWRWRSVLLLKKYLRGFYSRLENKHCSWWRPRRAFQLFKKYVFLSREFDPEPGNESCLRRSFQK